MKDKFIKKVICVKYEDERYSIHLNEEDSNFFIGEFIDGCLDTYSYFPEVENKFVAFTTDLQFNSLIKAYNERGIFVNSDEVKSAQLEFNFGESENNKILSVSNSEGPCIEEILWDYLDPGFCSECGTDDPNRPQGDCENCHLFVEGKTVRDSSYKGVESYE